jgi:hypothetical protein
VYLDIHLLSLLDIENVQRRVTRVDHLESASISGVVVAVEFAVIDGEAITPEVKLTLDAWGGLRRAGGGVGDGARRSVVASQCHTRASEGLWSRLLVITAGARNVPARC